MSQQESKFRNSVEMGLSSLHQLPESFGDKLEIEAQVGNRKFVGYRARTIHRGIAFEGFEAGVDTAANRRVFLAVYGTSGKLELIDCSNMEKTPGGAIRIDGGMRITNFRGVPKGTNRPLPSGPSSRDNRTRTSTSSDRT